MFWYIESNRRINQQIIMKKDIGICAIGAGRAAMIHANNHKNKVKGSHIESVVDVVEETVRRAGEELGTEKCYTDYRQAICDPAVDAVVIAAPTDMHEQIVIDCAEAGKHIFCEKPMAMNVEQCQRMLDVCKKNNVKLQIGFMRRFDASYMYAKELIESGEIGDIVLIRSNTRGPSKPKPWMYDLKKSNGILAEVNSHDIDSTRWFAGSEIAKLYAIGGNYRNPEVKDEYPDYYDNVIMNGQFENGIQFSIDGAAYVEFGYDSKTDILGTKGVLHIGRSDGAFTKCTTVKNGTSTPFVSSWTTLFKDAYLEEDTHFVESILNDTEPKVTGIDGLMAVKIVEAGNRSILSGEVIKMD